MFQRSPTWRWSPAGGASGPRRSAASAATVDHQRGGAGARNRRERQDARVTSGRVELAAKRSLVQIEHPAAHNSSLERGVVPARELGKRRVGADALCVIPAATTPVPAPSPERARAPTTPSPSVSSAERAGSRAASTPSTSTSHVRASSPGVCRGSTAPAPSGCPSGRRLGGPRAKAAQEARLLVPVTWPSARGCRRAWRWPPRSSGPC